MEMKIKVSDYIVDFLENCGVKHVFMLPGGMAMHINDSIGYSKRLKPVWMLHEQACAFAAESYARITNNLGVACVTCGPGATNTLTGVACAWIESTPLLVITGQVKRADIAQDPNLRQLGVQEVRIVEMAKPVTKYSVQVLNPEDIRFELEKAVSIAQEGRPGPVLLDIPVDVQACKVNPEELRSYIPQKNDYSCSEKTIDEVVSLLNNAKRPVFYVGAGVSIAKAKQSFRELAERLNIPTLCHWNGMDILENDHPLYMGRPGAVGQRAANFVLQNADVLITIGTRLALLQTGFNFAGYAKNAKHVMVDIDQAELDKPTLHPYLKVRCDAGDFINKLSARTDIQIGDTTGWISICKSWNQKYPSLNPEWLKNSKFVNSYYLMDAVSSQMTESDIYVGGRAGTCVDAAIQAFKVKKGQGVYVTKGLSSMGNGLPAAIGGAYATGKRVVCVNGDGGFVMNIQELEVVKRDNLPLKIFILDNRGYSTVRNTQTNVFDKHYMGCSPESGLTVGSIKRVAEAYGIKTYEICNHESMNDVIKEAFAYDGPVLVNVIVDPDQPIVPRQANYKTPEGQMASRPLEDMKPLLDPEEIKEIMSVSQM
ncbi:MULTISPECIES: thiamine pyrophosphate-binding protein [unclassified Bacteroides]|uniref:thiamine pyrophosphate-binding protein n=1 Tax=unclassified Bacteroides TaxID=2646097 RepID=UPI0004E17F72|nr:MULTISPECIES: thiamine pyrophosphate-binding protein [unclassified Bacteroides]